MSANKIPASITKRAKQPYRAPIASIFFNPKSPAYIPDILSSTSLQSYGLFNSQKVNFLINKMNLQKNISEVDQMAITGIVSTQLLYKMFIQNPLIVNNDNMANIKITRHGNLVNDKSL